MRIWWEGVRLTIVIVVIFLSVSFNLSLRFALKLVSALILAFIALVSIEIVSPQLTTMLIQSMKPYLLQVSLFSDAKTANNSWRHVTGNNLQSLNLPRKF